MKWRRAVEEYEAELYKVPRPKFFLFRVPKGELEVKRYEDGETELEIEFYDVKVPDGSAASVVIDGQVACQVAVSQRRGRLRLSTARGDAIPAVGDGSVGEIQYNGEPLLRGMLRPD
jgi:hypothetical protein